MTFSPLISGAVPHYNKFHSRQSQPIVRVLQHHHAASSNAGVDRLTNPTQPASSNYIIMSDGSILGQVPEEYRAWTSGSFEADGPSITIEVQNSGGQANGNDSDPASWPITDAAYNAIVTLVADVAKRYGWGGVAEGNYRGHREFSQTACPGGYIWARMSTIRAAANALLNGSTIQPQGTTTPKEWDEMASKEEIKEAIREESGNFWFTNAYGRPVQLWSILNAIDKNVNGNNDSVQGKLDRLIGETVGLRAAVAALSVGSSVTPEQVESAIKDALSDFTITLAPAKKGDE